MRYTTFIATLIASGLLVGSSSTASELDFSRDVLPILSDKCFACHGPDTDDGLLRLDTADFAYEDLGGYRAVDPDTPNDSELLQRIQSNDDPMPPVDADKQLTDKERETLAEWVLQGGSYGVHWAFVPPTASGRLDKHEECSVDVFIEQQLNEHNLEFAPEADRRTLARRAALVLTGLPPESNQLEKYLTSDKDNAFEEFVDQLLASPRFGEHQARFWLDAVRYGDTHGLHLDNRRGIYPYRDWVIKAFNDNLPLDQFIQWQLAGDMVETDSIEPLVASGFVRLNPSTGEGGAIEEEFQAKNSFDRVETLGTVFLGLTLTCSRCHNHKYDPISQQEYYELLAFFNNTAEPALDGNSYTYGTTVEAPSNQQQWQHWTKLEREAIRLTESARQTVRGEETDSPDRLMEFASGRKTDSAPVCFVSDAIRSDAGPPAFPSQSSTSDTEWKKLENWNGKVDESIELLAHRKPDWSRWIAFKVDCDSPQTFVLSYSGGSGSDVFLDNEQVAQTRADELIDDRELLLLSVSAGTHEVMVKLVGDETISRTELSWHSPWAGVSTAGWKHASLENRLWMIADPNGPFNETHFAQTAHSMARAIHRLRKQFTTTLVAKELPTPRNTHILRRGEYDLPIGDPLQPGVLSVLNGFPDAAPRNRLGLAQWMTSPDNPLPSRVLVNRMWQRVFGAALVRTPEDFGVQGEYPTHPDLLDWLAIELQQSGWDFKHMMRLLVTSQTFRQDSTWRDDANDPENRLFARGPAFRLDAEVIRDIGLWASGLLDPTMGGEGIKPYQPEGMWKALAHPASNTRHYEPDQGQRLYRRSIYVYWKRTSPHPMMTLFDAPDRESSCVRRSRTNTALQSLAMLNESQRMDMARALAGRLLSTCDHDEARVQLLFEIVAARPPLKNESDTCMELLDQMRKRYQTDQGAAAALIKVRTDDQPSELNLVETAAWTQVTSVVLASDLAVMLY